MSLSPNEKVSPEPKTSTNLKTPTNEVRTTVEGVMIFCNGEMKIRQEKIADRWARFKVIKISVNNPVFSQPISEMSGLLKIPPRLIHYPTQELQIRHYVKFSPAS